MQQLNYLDVRYAPNLHRMSSHSFVVNEIDHFIAFLRSLLVL